MKSNTAVIERLNSRFNDRWSFRVIEHQFRDAEIIVLGELTNGDSTRQQFGKARVETDNGTGETSSLGDDLNRASLDALANCAEMFSGDEAGKSEPETAGSESKEAAPKAPANGNGSKKLTSKQLAAIFGLGKSQGLGQGEVISLTTDRFGREPMELNRSEASEIIKEFTSKTDKEN